jgi:hypothetical protein
MPNLAIICAEVPPALLSLMPPVKGLFEPTESRPEFEATVPVSKPGANTSLLFGPSG